MKQEINNQDVLSPKKSSKLSSLVSAVSLLLVSMFVFGVGVLLLFQMIGIDEGIGGLLASQLAIIVLFFSLYKFKFRDAFSLFKKVSLKGILLALLATGAILAANVLISLIIKLFNLNADKVAEYTSNTTEIMLSTGGVVAMFLIPIVIAPLIEELAFRAGFKRILVDLGNWKPYQYVIISSLLFGLLHWQPGALGILNILLTGFLGVVTSILYLKTNNIMLSVITHVAYNFIILAIASAAL